MLEQSGVRFYRMVEVIDFGSGLRRAGLALRFGQGFDSQHMRFFVGPPLRFPEVNPGHTKIFFSVYSSSYISILVLGDRLVQEVFHTVSRLAIARSPEKVEHSTT